ncbi:MAG TPA: NAD(P)H-dependent oxidoreductase [Polyangiaceae bacterium]|nr:NAD(P)H-dependent oxidoreductase [Polyangiaceae bacterium]
MTETAHGQRVLILFAHPALHRSRVNRALVRAVRELAGVTFNDLYELYPDFDVDARYEQEQLLQHDLLVLQHPFYWYSTPALVKQWIDVVLEHGWAYGNGGTALRGKKMLSVITAGGGETAYGPDGINRHTMSELLTPLAQTARLCGMEYLPPYVLHGTHALTEAEIERLADEYRSVVEALRDGRADLEAARSRTYFNRDLDVILRS